MLHVLTPSGKFFPAEDRVFANEWPVAIPFECSPVRGGGRHGGTVASFVRPNV
jgi:hypothetical protein